jgi:hypothetical protein
MASKGIARSLLRQQCLSKSKIRMLKPAVVKSPLEVFTARRGPSSKRQDPVAVPVCDFSTSSHRRYATVDESLDFREQDRESDEVDVCIVGGGNYPPCASHDDRLIFVMKQVLQD